VIRLLRAALLLEFGFMLIVVPWSTWWDRNYFAAMVPQFHEFIINNFVRGAVSGLGFINLVAAISELVSVYVVREPSPGLGVTPPHSAKE